MAEYTMGDVDDARLEEVLAYLSAHEIAAARQRGEVDPVLAVETLRLFDGRITIRIDVKPPEQ